MIKFSSNSSPKVLLISDKHVDHTYTDANKYELQTFDVIHIKNDSDLLAILNTNTQVDAIISHNSNGWSSFKNLLQLPLEYRHKWIHYEDYLNHGNDIFNMIMNNTLSRERKPRISIFTSAYNIGSRILEAYSSLKYQTFTDWEWVIVNDSTDNITHDILSDIAKSDLRIKVYSFPEKTNGNIGEAKYRAAMLCNGEWLLELDHDDILCTYTLQTIIDAATEFPDSGFIYSDFIDIDSHSNVIEKQYGDKYAFGYGVPYKIKDSIWCNMSPNINSVTTRHIIGMPNHLRCWNKNIYHMIGGHNRDMRIADDFELCVRTFLVTKFTRIKYPCYLQKFDGTNSQDSETNRLDIQRRVRFVAQFYNEAIHKRFAELQCNDFGYSPNVEDIYNRVCIENAPFCNYLFIPNLPI